MNTYRRYLHGSRDQKPPAPFPSLISFSLRISSISKKELPWEIFSICTFRKPFAGASLPPYLERDIDILVHCTESKEVVISSCSYVADAPQIRSRAVLCTSQEHCLLLISPTRNIAKLIVVTQSLTFLCLMFQAEMTSTALFPIQSIVRHQLTNFYKVG